MLILEICSLFWNDVFLTFAADRFFVNRWRFGIRKRSFSYPSPEPCVSFPDEQDACLWAHGPPRDNQLQTRGDVHTQDCEWTWGMEPGTYLELGSKWVLPKWWTLRWVRLRTAEGAQRLGDFEIDTVGEWEPG
jgi:hypothetical protein